MDGGPGGGDQNHPQEKEMQEGKVVSEEALQIAEERREAKEEKGRKRSKGERERYTQRNAEFQRTARKDKKASFSDQCKEIEENNRMGRTRDGGA